MRCATGGDWRAIAELGWEEVRSDIVVHRKKIGTTFKQRLLKIAAHQILQPLINFKHFVYDAVVHVLHCSPTDAA